jgi:hypothetical protein
VRPDERQLIEALVAAFDGGERYVSAWMVSETFDRPVHERRLRYLIGKWIKRGHWSPLMSLSGEFTAEGWRWVERLGISRKTRA